MIIYQNNVIVTPIKTGTHTLTHLLFERGASILHSGADFLNEGKTGSIENALYDKVQSEQIIDMDTLSQNIDPHQLDHSFIVMMDKKVFVTVRNPYDLLVSYYYFYVNPFTQSIYKNRIYSSPELSYTSFKDWIMSLENKNTYRLSLLTIYNHIKANGFIRLEFLAQDLKQIGITLHPDDIPIYNKNPKRPDDLSFKDEYTKEVLEKVNAWYRDDILFFGYPVLEWDSQNDCARIGGRNDYI